MSSNPIPLQGTGTSTAQSCCLMHFPSSDGGKGGDEDGTALSCPVVTMNCGEIWSAGRSWPTYWTQCLMWSSVGSMLLMNLRSGFKVPGFSCCCLLSVSFS